MTPSGSWSPPPSPHENIHPLGKRRRAPTTQKKKEKRLRTPAKDEVSFSPSHTHTPAILASDADAHVSACGSRAERCTHGPRSESGTTVPGSRISVEWKERERMPGCGETVCIEGAL